MAITCITRDHATYVITKDELFAGRVLRVEKTVETRNWSDTMDYTDFRTTQCTWALVWLGTFGIAPERINTDRPKAHWGSLLPAHDPRPNYLTPEPRELEYFEQFAWVDCTNLHADRMAVSYVNPTTDAAPFISGDPLMWANFIAWEAYMDSAKRDRSAKVALLAVEAERARRAEEEKQAARQAKKEAKLASTRAQADAEYAAALPFKGKTVMVDGFTGTVFWMGVKAYRGTFNANAGLRNSKGEVQWIRCNQLF